MLSLCNYSLVFSDKDDKPVSQPFNVHNPVARKRTHTLVAKSRARSSRCCGLSSVVYHGWEGKKGATVIGASCCCALPA